MVQEKLGCGGTVGLLMRLVLMLWVVQVQRLVCGAGGGARRQRPRVVAAEGPHTFCRRLSLTQIVSTRGAAEQRRGHSVQQRSGTGQLLLLHLLLQQGVQRQRPFRHWRRSFHQPLQPGQLLAVIFQQLWPLRVSIGPIRVVNAVACARRRSCSTRVGTFPRRCLRRCGRCCRLGICLGRLGSIAQCC